MAYRVHHYNKKNGITYVYEAVSVWDKEKKTSTNKQVCIGKLDLETGELIPSKRLNSSPSTLHNSKATATSLVAGPSLLLDSITQELGIEKLLKKCFPNDHQQVLSVVYFLVQRGQALSHCESWCKGHLHPYSKGLTSQAISKLLASQTEDARQTFFKQWSRVITEKECLCYDITSVSSYSEQNEYVKYGYNRDKEKLPQINMAMLFGQQSRLPVYYKRLPGNITDVSTLSNFLKTMNFLGNETLHLVLDKGFYSNANVDELFAAHHKFTMGVSIHLKWVQEIVDEFQPDMLDVENYRKIGDDVLYVRTKLYKWGTQGKRSYVHVYHNARAAAEDRDDFHEKLLEYKAELESGHRVKEHESFYQRYFIIKNTPVRGVKVRFNPEAVQGYRKRYAGFFILFTTGIKNPATALDSYRNKDVVENCFDDLKNQLDMKRLRVHHSSTMDGRIFLQFIALIYISAIRNTIQKHPSLAHFTVKELLEEMETLSKITYSGRYGSIFTESTKMHKEIARIFNIDLKT
ncbi:IS1634 family transposase [Paenibacillus donghaensis]|uniref:Transposase n=1 Tax=Paenibacillus donghaensis TaxID=414771 RepID=A0A2Z2K3D7_9BACL|nr:transposase [Paenibacillus donghaensis]ASA19806.1 transposase [Paenibacillus donghaensis]